ncbi:MAG: DUF11 domain-containing protein [Myxococcota bacterium]|nr:DUF11 domain-containing protein [Myxococcota bacterium]
MPTTSRPSAVRLAALVTLSVLVQSCLEAAAPQPALRLEARRSGPAVRLAEPHPVPVTLLGGESTAGATPLSLTTADVDRDGFLDLIVGYRLRSGRGLIALQRGNREALAPSVQALESLRAPFLREAKTFPLPVAPELLAAARIGTEGSLELFAAARGDRQLIRLKLEGDPAVIALPGEVTALAAGELGDGERLLIGYARGGDAFLRVQGAQAEDLPLPAAVTQLAFGELDGDGRSDAALIAGGQVLLLKSGGGLVGLGLQARSLAIGAFVPEQSGRLQLALLSEEGEVSVAVHPTAAPRLPGARALSPNGRGRPVDEASPVADASSRWTVIESHSGLVPPRSEALLFRTRVSGNATDELALFVPQLGELSVIAHRAPGEGETGFVPAEISTRPHPGSPVAALSMRLDTPVGEGLVVLEPTTVEVQAVIPMAAAIFVVNTPLDTVDAFPGNGACADAAGNCSLRAAVMESNFNPGDDTIQLPAGIFTLTRAGANEDGATTGDLDIREAVSIVGAGPGATIIQAGPSLAGTRVDKIFSVNPTFTSAFNTAITGVTLRYGRNPSPWGGAGFGGALDWEASGTGNLTLTDVIVEDNETLDGDGGGLALTSFPAGSGRATLNNVIVRRNKAARSLATNTPVGGGVFVGTGTPLQMTLGEVSSNQAVGNASPNWKGQGGGVLLLGPNGALPSFFAGTNFAGNQAGEIGGAVHTGQGLQFTGEPVFSGNSVLNGTGGAIFHNTSNSTTSLVKATFTGNSAAAPNGSAVAASGGAIQVGSSATGNLLTVGYSRFAQNTVTTAAGAAGPGTAIASTGGTVTAENNWWSCSTGPTAAPCNTASGAAIDFNPWLRLTHVASPSTLQIGDSSSLTASFLTNSDNTAVSLSNLSVLLDLGINFTSGLGTISGAQSTIQANGTAIATFTATAGGAGWADATVDGGPTRANITVLAPDLVVTKSHTGDFTQGDFGRTYTLTVTNQGPGRTQPGIAVTVVDTLPAGLTATALSGTGWSCTLSPLSCTRSDQLASGASYPAITLTVDVARNAAPLLTNQASVSGGGELVVSNNTVSDPTVIIQLPDLVVAKSHGGDFRQGQVGATYSLTVSNVGPGPTTAAVTVTDTLPAGLTATAISGTGWTCDLGTLGCTRSDLLANGAAYPVVTLTVNVAADAPLTVTNNAAVSGGGELENTNNTASDPTNVVPVGDLVVAKSHAGDFRQGQVGATYALVVSNLGPGSTLGVVTLTDTLPTGLTATAIAGTGWSCDLGTLTCTRSDVLAASAAYPAVTLTVNVAADAPSSVTNTAQVAGGGELETGNNSASDPTTVIPVADLTISKSHIGDFRQGQTGAFYSLAVSNPGGGATLGAVSVTDTLPTGLTATAIAGTGWSCDLGTLTCSRSDAVASGAAYPVITLTVDLAGNAPASVTNTAQVSGGGELNGANNSASDLTTVIAVGDLTVAKSHVGDFRKGQTGATYSLVVSNLGPGATLGAVSLTDTLPAGLTATALSGTGWTCDLGNLTCTRADVLAAGGAYPPITLTVNVATNAPPSVTNTAQVTGGGELQTGNNSDSDVTTVLTVGDLVIAKSHVGNFRQGQLGATYSLEVANIGVASSVGTVSVTDTLPAGLTATGISGTGWSCDTPTLTCTRSEALASGASYPVLTVTVDVASDAAPTVVNAASVSGGGEVDTSNSTALDPTAVEQVPDLVVTKTHQGDFQRGASGASYTLTVSNPGSGDTLGAVTVTDTLPTGLTATALVGAGWTCDLDLLTCTRSDVLTGGASFPAITLTVDVANDAPASLINVAQVSGGSEDNTANNTASDPTTTVIPVADLTVTKTHPGDARQGQTGLIYTLVVSNTGPGPTQGLVSLTDTLPAGLTATAISGTGWSCDLGTLSCTRSDVLGSGASYPEVTVTVDVGTSAVSGINTGVVSGGGQLNTGNDTAADPTQVVEVADLTLTKSHEGDFVVGQAGALYTLRVLNGGGGPTVGVVTVVDQLPDGLIATSLQGDGWSCELASLTCTRSDALAGGSSYPDLLLAVDVAGQVGEVVNTATVSGGGQLDTTNDGASDPTQILAAPVRGCGCGSTDSGANSMLAALGLALLWRVRRRGQLPGTA